jgi:beta-glucosidase
MILSTRSARPYRWAALGVVSIAAVALLGASQRPKDPAGVAPYRNANAPVELRVQDLLHRMTLEEKVRQLDMYAGAKEIMNEHADDTHAGASAQFDPSKAQLAWGSLGVGSIHDLHPTPRQYDTIQAWVIAHNRLGIPALFIEEGLHGYDTGTVFPAPIGLAATWDPMVAEQTAAAIAAEARANGVDMILAPVLDIARDPRWGRVEEDFGEDPYLTGQMGLAYVRGAQGDDLATDHTVVAEPKHFVGHGSPEGGTNTSPVHMGERHTRCTRAGSTIG